MRTSYPIVRVKRIKADRITELEAEVSALRLRLAQSEAQRLADPMRDRRLSDPWRQWMLPEPVTCRVGPELIVPQEPRPRFRVTSGGSA